jgi:hypothetical protein
VEYFDSKDEDNMIGLVKWVKGKKAMSCPFGKKEPKKFDFDITKVDKIFDLLLPFIPPSLVCHSGPSSGTRAGYSSFGSSALRWEELLYVAEADVHFHSWQESNPLGCYREHNSCSSD